MLRVIEDKYKRGRGVEVPGLKKKAMKLNNGSLHGELQNYRQKVNPLR